MLIKHSVDISAILTHLVWKIFFSIPHITTIFPHRTHHLVLLCSLATVAGIPEQILVHRAPLKGGKPTPFLIGVGFYRLHFYTSRDSWFHGIIMPLWSFSQKRRCSWPWGSPWRKSPCFYAVLGEDQASTSWEVHLLHFGMRRMQGQAGRHLGSF